ncbi:hypothetical protein BJ322DRAFT_826989 [Thelephora terrestris]|uniref:BTB domain-containing protein n=1 Tax=Thelephora terrestris TaxID=56493 RepID=A0A9P6HF22_9AGAM|nr:hypothetical protein BJ322DRAFT_826989 [Thelephora terrestris]
MFFSVVRTNFRPFGEGLSASELFSLDPDFRVRTFRRSSPPNLLPYFRGSFITKPTALYANTHVLKTVPYFSDLLSGVYSETEPKDFSEPIDEDEQAENYGHYADSDLEDEDDAVYATWEAAKTAAPPKRNPPSPSPSPADDGDSEPVYGERNESSRKGTIIKIHDIALITFQAFLMYLYTGQIEFAPYGSEENRRSRSVEIVSTSDDSIPQPSPKSIYRLAHMYDIPALQQLALDSIRNGLEQCDTVEEVFSEFSSKYEVVRNMHVNHLVSVLFRADKGSAGPLYGKIDEKIDRYANGDLDHAADVITDLWKLSKANEGSPPVLPDEVPPVSPQISPTPSPANWMRVEVALIKSIRKGIFFDRKYWTRHSQTKSALRPIYISSAVLSGISWGFNDLVKMYREDDCPDTGTYEESEDSDCEGIPEPVSVSSQRAQADEKEKREPELLPVLTVGSFTSWRSLFFYMCTDIIRFAPLKSQGIDVRARHIQEQTMQDKPPPCSPKAIYSLATALWNPALRNLAFEDIRSKIADANVVTELFSSHASRKPDITRMECELLYDKFNNEASTAKGVELIESMIGGNSAHRSGALKLGLRRGLSGTVFLRCSRSTCDLHTNPQSCRGSSGVFQSHGWFGSSVLCQLCCSRLQCAGCGTSPIHANFTSCQGCDKWFK